MVKLTVQVFCLHPCKHRNSRELWSRATLCVPGGGAISCNRNRCPLLHHIVKYQARGWSGVCACGCVYVCVDETRANKPRGCRKVVRWNPTWEQAVEPHGTAPTPAAAQTPPQKCPTRTRSECVMASKQHKARSWSLRELTFETVIRGGMWRQVVVFPPREEGSSGGAAPAGCAGFAGGGGD